MKKLSVNIAEVADLMEMNDHEDEYYLDLQNGEPVVIPRELLREGWKDDDDMLDLPEWEKELRPIAEAITAGSNRYVPIPDVPSWDAYEDLVQFAETVTDPKLREFLAIALDGKGAFRRFRSVLDRNENELKRWYAFKDEAMVRRVREWLNGIGIEPIQEGADAVAPK
ncbi:MAG: hypothetical protein JSU63_06985 [Phycisphaerales bacterium]|nr:MAG: hypothetical protein JSU63_06985 [Phycisphaerales bacterium]